MSCWAVGRHVLATAMGGAERGTDHGAFYCRVGACVAMFCASSALHIGVLLLLSAIFFD